MRLHDQGPPATGGKFLTFHLGAEEFGFEILKVQEIIGLQPITAVPGTPGHVRGVINLRGKTLPIMDLRRRFGMEAREDTDSTCIIVVEARGSEVGIVVDEVSEVVEISDGDIEPTPDMGGRVAAACLLGIAHSAERLRLLLDVDRVLAGRALEELAAAAA